VQELSEKPAGVVVAYQDLQIMFKNIKITVEKLGC